MANILNERIDMSEIFFRSFASSSKINFWQPAYNADVIRIREILMLSGFKTIKEAMECCGRSDTWLYVGLRTDKIKGIRVGRSWLIYDGEIERIKDGEITITRDDMKRMRK